MNSAQISLSGGFVTNAFPHGTVHEAGDDLQAAVRSNPKILTLWENLTPLGRNEFICWVDDAKQAKTRQRRIERTCDRSEEHTSELQSLMRISYAVFCLKKKNTTIN